MQLVDIESVTSQKLTYKILTRWELMYNNTCTLRSCISHYFHTTLQLRNLSANWAKEMFNPSKDASSLLV